MSILINYGFLVFGLTDDTGVKVSAHYVANSEFPPTADREMEACRRLGLRLSEWVATMIDGRKDAHPLNQTYDRFGDLGK
jgi:NAD(P)H dehydrogenase (quinone)